MGDGVRRLRPVGTTRALCTVMPDHAREMGNETSYRATHHSRSSYPYPPPFLNWMRAVFARPQPFIDALIADVTARGIKGVNVRSRRVATFSWSGRARCLTARPAVPQRVLYLLCRERRRLLVHPPT